MNDVVISVENLSKSYRLGIIGHGTLYRDLQSLSAKLLGKEDPNSPLSMMGETRGNTIFHALHDVSFTVRQGDILGVVGRNGAGKSTLLKIISRVTAPTDGIVKIKGRVASLLEVGTGFHPELTGRENIFLNGAILGMTKREISRKFDEVVDFAEVETFIDTPVKRYSSGMYVRLAFAVAAHLEPEILVVDEVLAVGDARFQKKCLGKMQSVGNSGRTVLFVSHNMNAIEQLCKRAILLHHGNLSLESDNVREVINKHLASSSATAETIWEGNGACVHQNFSPTRMYLTVGGLEVTNAVSNSDQIEFNVEGTIERYDQALQVGYAIYNEDNVLVFWSLFNDVAEEQWPPVFTGKIRFSSCLPSRFLNEGTYRFELISALYYREWITQPGVNAPYLQVNIQGGLSDSPYWLVRRPGLMAPVIPWTTQSLG